MNRLACLLLAFVLAVPAAAELAPLVTAPAGALRGVATGQGGRAFLGIPYAEPPLGALRWRAPQALPAWSQPRDATRFGPVCTQPGPVEQGAVTVVGSEDCLTLNVWVPPQPRHALPVMLFIHGGGQLYGSGADYDGAVLAQRGELLVVTVNYRLGPFGWFHHPALTDTPAGRSSGQFGLLDLIAALRWVQANIAAFGGDAHRVTIMGESAGAQNVYALYLSPLAKGLFAGAIAESGGFWNMTLAQAIHLHDEPERGSPASAREIVVQWLQRSGRAPDRAAALQLEQQDPAALATWLRGLDAGAVLAPYAGRDHIGYDLPSVVYDGIAMPQTEHRAALRRGLGAPVPLLIGGNRDEEKAYLSDDDTQTLRRDAVRSIRRPREYAALNRFYSDWWTYMDTDDLLGRVAAPIYAYRFEWDDEPRAPSDVHALFGAGHGLELPFVFGRFADAATMVGTALPLFDAANRRSRQRISAAMISYWAAFAHHGAPGRGLHGEWPLWPAWQDAHTRQVFGNGVVYRAAGRLDGQRILRDLWRSRDLTPAQKCTVFLDLSMYPAYPAEELRQRGCVW